ncbi:hypothetical protein [Brucella gallinifaecis]|uniref:hypothetical protein n=1 Tax=Brucella gallinifaecis TaxID=215590 RepID=UPI00235FABE4|nr:hypothetical protein [Brucella gallinifaecis]
MMKLHKINMNPCVLMLAAGLLLMISSAVSVELVSAAYGFDFSNFDLATEMSLEDLTVFEMMTEFTLPIAFICGIFLAAGGMSGWLLFDGRNSLNDTVFS